MGLNRPPTFNRLRDAIGLRSSRTRIDDILGYFNHTRPRYGFVFRHYCLGGRSNARRVYFSDENGRRCDGVRQSIETFYRDEILKESEYYYLLASLIVAMDRVANTASVYAAYLKKLKKSARRPFTMEPIPTTGGNGRHSIYNKNGADLVSRVSCDILYMDPPYNQRQYCTNYHVLETIAEYDNPKLSGVTGLRPYENQRSDFCVKGKVLAAIEEMIVKTRARYVFLSYNSEGIVARSDILSMMRRYGEVDVKSKQYPRFRADTDGANRRYKADNVNEYLFRLRKWS